MLCILFIILCDIICYKKLKLKKIMIWYVMICCIMFYFIMIFKNKNVFVYKRVYNFVKYDNDKK